MLHNKYNLITLIQINLKCINAHYQMKNHNLKDNINIVLTLIFIFG